MGGIVDLFTGNKAAKAQSKAADKAAQASQYATDQSIALQREQFNRIWGATQGARDLGNTATTKLQALANGTLDPTSWIQSTPGYKTNLDAGQRQMNASLAAKGGLLSGDAIKEAAKYGSDYNNGIYNQERNALMGYAGPGQTATNTGAQTGQATANASQNALQQNASNLASSYGQKADAQSWMWGQAGNALGGMTGGGILKAFKGLF